MASVHFVATLFGTATSNRIQLSPNGDQPRPRHLGEPDAPVDRRPPRDVPLDPGDGRDQVRLLHPDGTVQSHDVAASENGLFMSERRPHVLLDRRLAGPPGHRRVDRLLRVRRQPPAAAHLGDRRPGPEAPASSASAPTASTPTSRPGSRSSARTRSGPSSSSTTPASAAASRSRCRRRPAQRLTSATGPSSSSPARSPSEHRRRTRRGRQPKSARGKGAKKKKHHKKHEADTAASMARRGAGHRG